LTGFVKRKDWRPQVRGYCAIGARGISLRRLSLPPSTHEELRRVLLLQIESEFPLPPDELAWGYCLLNGQDPSRNAPPPKQEALVVAAKKRVIEEYSEILAASGINAVFTLAALARSCLCPWPQGVFSLLDIGCTHSELVSFEEGVATSVRVLAWGGENVTRALEEQLGIPRDEAQRLQFRLDQEPIPDGEAGRKIRGAVEAALTSLAASLNGKHAPRKLFLTGSITANQDLLQGLGERLGGVPCERIDAVAGKGRSPAILGLKKSVESGLPLLIIQGKPAAVTALLSRPEPKKWARVAALLAGIALFLPYAEVALLKPHLSKKLAALKTGRGRLEMIDNEFSFLQYLRRAQPAYLDALFVVSKAAPGGARFDSVSINRRGELALRGFMMGAQQVADFRSKLLDSGFFATVIVEDQTPAPDRQRVNVRINAQWKPVESRTPPTVETSPMEGAKPGGSAREPPPGFTPSPPSAGTLAGPAAAPRPPQRKE